VGYIGNRENKYRALGLQTDETLKYSPGIDHMLQDIREDHNVVSTEEVIGNLFHGPNKDLFIVRSCDHRPSGIGFKPFQN
jgi:hypothetical protein